MKVIGVELYDKGITKAKVEFLDLLNHDPKNRLISPSDATVLVYARQNPDFRAILKQFYWNLPDGVPSVWLLKLKGAKHATRCSGPDFFEEMIKATKGMPVNHFLCGGAEDIAEKLESVCKTWGNDHIVGHYSPPYKALTDEDIKSIAKNINTVKTHVLWIGLGTPKQIYFAHRISQYTNTHFIVPIGAAFDFHTGNVKKAPQWIQKIGMEWLYRVSQEPMRLSKRYFKVVPLFIWFSCLDFFKRKT